MDYSKRHFMIFDVTELHKIDFTQVKETSAETVRRSLTGARTFVKWDTDEIPASVASLETQEGPYTYEEMTEILMNSEWNDPNPIIGA